MTICEEYYAEEFEIITCGKLDCEHKALLQDRKEHNFNFENKVPMKICKNPLIWDTKPHNAPIPGRSY